MSSMTSFALELSKLAAPRSYVRDFAAGIDPFGTFTTNYGVQDAGISEGDARRRRAVGTAGGLAGGALVVPGVISGMIGGVKGLASGGLRGAGRGALFGAHKMYSGLYRGAKGVGSLGRAMGGKGISVEEARNLGALAKRLPVQHPLATQVAENPGLIQKGLQLAPKEEIGRLRQAVQNDVTEGAAALGLSGGIGGAAAYMGYGKGRELGGVMTQEGRDRVTPGVAPGGKQLKMPRAGSSVV